MEINRKELEEKTFQWFNIYTLIDSVLRVGSLTEQPDNLLMWAHYAGAYRGVYTMFFSCFNRFSRAGIRHSSIGLRGR